MPEIVVHVIKGKDAGKSFTVAQPMTAGRSPKVPLFLDDTKASRQHAQFRPTNGGLGLEVEDLGSANGTQLNGKTFKGIRTLFDGDKVAIGESVLQVKAPHLVKPAEANPPPSAKAPSSPNIKIPAPESPVPAASSPGPGSGASAPVMDALAAMETQKIPAIKLDEPPKSKSPSQPVMAATKLTPKPSGASDKLKRADPAAPAASKPTVKKAAAGGGAAAGDGMQLKTRGKEILKTQKSRGVLPNLGVLSEDWSSQTFGRQVLLVLIMGALAVAMAALGWMLFGGCDTETPRRPTTLASAPTTTPV